MSETETLQKSDTAVSTKRSEKGLKFSSRCLTCEVCGKRRGRETLAGYRWKGEPWDAWKNLRILTVCAYCANKGGSYGYFGNDRITVMNLFQTVEEWRKYMRGMMRAYRFTSPPKI